MRRKLFTASSVVSLLLCVATAGLWVRSYWRWDEWYLSREWFESKRWTDRTLRLWSGGGGFNLGWSSAYTVEANVEWGQFPDRVGKWHWEHRTSNDPLRPSLSDEVETEGHEQYGYGVGFARGFLHMSWRDGYQWEVTAPYYACAGLSAFLPALSLLQLKRPTGKDCCKECGYNLTGNASGVCPECGTAVAGKGEA